MKNAALPIALAAAGFLVFPLHRLALADVSTTPAADLCAPHLALDDFTALLVPQPANPRRVYAAEPKDEDWRWLAQPHADHDLFDPLKYIPLTSNGDLSLSLGGSTRFRFEEKINPGFGATNKTNTSKNADYDLYRAFLHADVRYSDIARLFVEGDFSYLDRSRRHPAPTPSPSDDADIHQLFLDISPFNDAADKTNFTLRLGRQELSFDRQKLVGSFDWSNTRRSFDGVDGILHIDDYAAELFWVRPVAIEPKSLDEDDDQTHFIGAHLAHPLFTKDHHYSLFAYYLNQSRNTQSAFAAQETNFNPDHQRGDTDRVTLGARVWGRFGNIDYDVEGGPQFGRDAQNDVLAGYFSGEAGYTFAALPAAPRLSIGYDYASGDSSPTDRQSNTFNQLFPTGHWYLGYLDFVGRQNEDAGNITLTLNPARNLKLWATWHYLALASTSDALYNAAGQTLRYSPTGTADAYIGNETDLTASYQLGRHTTFLTGYGIFVPGSFIQQTGKSELAQMFYTSVEFKF